MYGITSKVSSISGVTTLCLLNGVSSSDLCTVFEGTHTLFILGNLPQKVMRTRRSTYLLSRFGDIEVEAHLLFRTLFCTLKICLELFFSLSKLNSGPVTPPGDV